MLTTLAKKTFDFYSAPARFAIKKTQQHFDFAKNIAGDLKKMQVELNQFGDDLKDEAAHQLHINLEKMSQEEREFAAQKALSRAEQGFSVALTETLRALVLLSAGTKQPLSSKNNTQTLEGKFERVD